MISIESRLLTELTREAERAVREFQLTLRWVMDPNARSWMDDEEWGNLVLLLALLGKIEFIDGRMDDEHDHVKIRPLADFSQAKAEWEKYQEEGKASVEARLTRQFELTVDKRYRELLDPRLPVELADFAAFLLERDTIEFFLLGCDKEAIGTDFRSPIDPLDMRMRSKIERNILPTLKGAWPAERLATLTHPLLPPSFWWRHLLPGHHAEILDEAIHQNRR